MGDYSGVDNLDAMRQAKRYNNFLIEMILRHSRGTNRALDFGAGTGTFCETLRHRGLSITCVESDNRLATKLRNKDFDCFRKLEDLPKSYSYIYSLNVLEHISDDQQILNNLFKKLSPGGRLLIYVPAFMVLFSNHDHEVGHQRRYSRRELERKISDAGLKIKKSTYVDSLGFLAALVYRLARVKSGKLSSQQVRRYDKYIFPMSQLFDRVLGPLIGKNIMLVAEKPHL